MLMKKGYVDKTLTENQKPILKSKKSKYDLQPYIGSHSCRCLSQNMSFRYFRCPRTLLDYKLRDFKSCMKRICLQKMGNFIRFSGGKFYGRYCT